MRKRQKLLGRTWKNNASFMNVGEKGRGLETGVEIILVLMAIKSTVYTSVKKKPVKKYGFINS